MSPELENWIARSRAALGTAIDDKEGQVVRGNLGITSRMSFPVVQEVAQILGEDVNEIRVMRPVRLLNELTERGY